MKLSRPGFAVLLSTGAFVFCAAPCCVAQTTEAGTRSPMSAELAGEAAAAQPAAGRCTPKLPERRPEELGFRAQKLAEIDVAVEAALAEDQMPGCVVVVGRLGGVAWRKAYGQRRIEPMSEAMTLDTVFDLASLTKPLATGLCAMTLVEEHRLQLADPAAKYWPQFAAHGKDAITVQQLLLHTGGLIADNPLTDYSAGPAPAWRQIADLRPQHAPGERFVYSDVSFLVLGQVVERASGQSLATLARQRIYEPLGMTETTFLPAAELRERAAPTERRAGEWIQGEVHDPRAFALGGVAGHAGLFSTADDLSVLAAMLLGRGEYGGVRVLSEEVWRAMTAPQELPPGRKPGDGAGSKSAGLRCLGWDMQTGFSSNRGRSLSAAAFGHGGFTGTSLWIDPDRDLFVLFLSNRLHPSGQGSVNGLAGQIATIAAQALE